MSLWSELAAEAEKAGYVPGDWETLLSARIPQNFPELVRELGADLTHYIRVKAASAVNQYEFLTAQGTPPDTARELVLAELLTVPESPEPPDESE